MHNRFILPKVILMTIAVMALIAIPALTLADSRDNIKSMTGEQQQSLMKSNSNEDGAKKPVRFQRTNYLWPYVTGPYYGDVPANLTRSPDYLLTMVGSFNTSTPITDIPGELRKDLSPLSQIGMQYFIVQFNPDAFDNGKFQNLRKEYESMGVQFFDYLPNRAYIVLLNASNHQIVSSSSAVKFIEPYHPAFRISPMVGRTPLPDPVKAVSPIYTLKVVVFPNESAELVAGQISKMGGFVTQVHNDTISVEIERSLIGGIAQIEAVRAIFEDDPMILHGEETTSTMQVGENAGPDMYTPYFEVGIDGSGAGIAAGKQMLCVIDSGISLDAKDLAHNTDSDTGNTPGPSHRKVYKYATTSVGGGTGDLLSCDHITSGGYSHGHTVSSTALGNATDIPSGSGTPTYFTDENDNQWKIDGVAKGALLVMYDGTVSAAPCPSGISSGDLYNLVAPGSSTLGDGYSTGARGFNMSFGGGSDTYTAGSDPEDIDVFLSTEKEALVFVSAGNDGGDDDNDNIPDQRTVFQPANAKNAIAMGASFNSNPGSAADPDERYFQSSVGPVGDATHPRVKPDLMAPGTDNGGYGSNAGMDSEYSCKSNDNDQLGTPMCDISQGFDGTSLSSPAGMGTSALVRDYFAQGFYPDGTSANVNNVNDRIATVSGALVKAVLIASADFMDGATNLTIDYRHNYEQGYGRIQLSNVLPLVSEPDTPTGLIIDDQGLSGGIIPNSYAQDVFEVTDAGEPLKIAVAWMDTAGWSLNNDLDLTVACDVDEDGTIDSNEPTWWGNYFTEDWLTGSPLERDGTLNTSEDNNGDGTMNAGEWSLPIVDSGKAFRDDLNPNEGIWINPEDMVDKDGDGTEDDPMTGQWIWRLDADSGNAVAMPYGLAIAGGVSIGSSIRFDKAPILCADVAHLTVYEIDDGSPPTAGNVSTNTTVYVINPGPDGQLDGTNDTTYDTETGITFTQQGTAYRFLSEDLPATDAGTQADNNGILDIAHGYYIKADYVDSSESKTKLTWITADCTVKLDKGVTFVQPGRDLRTLIDGGCETNGLGFADPDKYLDVDEKIVYWVAIINGDVDLVDVEVTLSDYEADTTNDSPYINVLTPTKNVGFLTAGSTMGIPFELEVVGSPTFPEEVDMVIGLRSAKSGKTVAETETFRHLINADDQVYHYTTDCPTGCKKVRDYNNDEEDTPDCSTDRCRQLDEPGEDWDLWYEVVNYDDMTTTAYGGGNPGHTSPWNFDTDNGGFRSGVSADSTQGLGVIANWGEDMDWDDTLDAGEDRDDIDGTLDQNWAIQNPSYGQCGWQTPYGIWHTGSTHPAPKGGGQWSCAGSGDILANKIYCQFYETRSGTSGEDYWFELLRSPELYKVHQDADGNNYDYYTEFHFMSLQWNQQVDLIDDFVLVTYEIDTDTSTDIGVKIDDMTVFNLFAGPMTIREGGSGNQPLLDGFSVFAPSDSSGDEENGSDLDGNNRTGSRGCYFQSGDLSPYNEDTQPHGLAKPEDDDIDNDGDGTIDEYVTANGPIRNMDTQKNNGLPWWSSFEDLYGDAGTAYEVVFGFYVGEGTDDAPTAGYGLAIDDVALEWDEMHPVEDNWDCSTTGQCGSLSVKTIDMYEGNSLIPVIVLDYNAGTTQGTAPPWSECDFNEDGTIDDTYDSDSDGTLEIAVMARSEAEPEGECFLLEQSATNSFEWSGVIPVSSSYDTEGTIYIQRKGVDLPTLTVQYVDKNDGVSGHTYSKGADGDNGEDGVDDDGDGTIDEDDEFCPLGAGDVFRAYGDDQCGCPDNPLEIGSTVEYVVGRMAVETVEIVSDNGDNDGFADACETVVMDITLRNLARVAGEFIDLTGVKATIQEVTDADNDGTYDDAIACITDPGASYGDIPMPDPDDPTANRKKNPATDRFEFQVSCNVDRSSIYENLNATFDLNVSSAEIDGLYQPLRIAIPLDLDHTGGGSVISEEFEDFDGASYKIDWYRVADTVDGQRCQWNDPDNPDGYSYGRTPCRIDYYPGYTDQDWHIHDTTMPDGGRAYDGTKSLHFGYHSNPSDAGGDTLHFQEMNIAHVTAANRINLGMENPELSFKHQLNLLDSRWSNTPGGEAADRAIVMVAKTNNAGAVQADPNESDRQWYKIFPYDNVYNAQGTDQFSNCTFDPTDDGSNEDDFFPNTHFWGPSSTCMPEFVWSWMGDTDHEATFDPEGYGAGNPPGLAGSDGPGTWVQSKFSLYQYRGYQIRFRFLATTIDVFPAQTYLQAGWPTNMDGDDGWYVDDIRVTNMLNSPVTLSDDAYTDPSPTCPTDPAQFCDTVTPELTCLNDEIDNDQDGSIDEAGEDNCTTLAPGHAFTLSAATSYANKCVDGALNYKFWLDSDGDGTITDEPASNVLYDWSDKFRYVDNPVDRKDYCVEVRCATDTDCSGHTCVEAGYQEPVLIPGPVFNFKYNAGSKTTIGWDVEPLAASYDCIKGDLDELIANSGDFSLSSPSCYSNDTTSTQITDTNEPTGAGQGFYYLARAGNASGNGTYDTTLTGGEGRDTGIGSTCP